VVRGRLRIRARGAQSEAADCASATRPTRGEQRTILLGFATLAAIMAAHAVRETARDALFLASVPATELPYAYLAIAGLSWAALRLHGRLFADARDKRRLLAITLAMVGAVDVAFFRVVDRHGGAELFALYVWSGVAAKVVTVQLWLLVDEAVTLERAPRIFGSVAAGGAAGAMLGSLCASALVCVAPAHDLLLLAATFSFASAGMPLFFAAARGGEALRKHNAPPQRSAAYSEGHRLYVRRLFGLVMVSTLALTAIDYVFKAELARALPSAALGPFFAWFYAGVNGAALLVQLVLSGWLLRAFGVRRALATVPGLLLFLVMGFACAPGLLAVLFLKSADGAMRHSLHRTGMEVLHLPLSSGARSRSKGFIDALGQRMGQALASVGVLVATRFGLGPVEIAWGAAAFVAVWLIDLGMPFRPRPWPFDRDARGLFAMEGVDSSWPDSKRSTSGPSRSLASRR
jgi:AAA family ATP:ADP antiporter